MAEKISSPSGERIMVVDDEGSLRKLVARKLKRQGFDVIEAEDGPHAESTWSEHTADVDLLLTDLRMPNGFSGLELARRLQKKRPDLKVLFMTGYSEDLQEEGAGLEENVDFVSKPFGLDALMGVIRERLDTDNRPRIS